MNPRVGAEKSSKSRRGRGEGTVYYDQARDRYIGAVTVAGKRRKVIARTKTDARARLAELLAAKTTSTPLPNKKMTVADAVTTYLERELPEMHGRGGRTLAPNTVDMHRWATEIIVAELGSVRLFELSVEDVEEMMTRLATRPRTPLAAGSLRKVRSVLQRVLAAAVRRGHVAWNVATPAKLPAQAVRRAADAPGRNALSPSAARNLLRALPDERLGAMFALCLRLGIRPGEAAGLYWSDLDGDVLNIRRSVRVIRGRPVVVDEVKTTASRRSLGLPPELVTWLADHRRAQVAEMLAAPEWHDDRLMFPSISGRVLSPSNVRRQLAAICHRAGVPVVRPNELRHSCASLLSDEGVPLELIADLLGHVNTRMLQVTYRHRLSPVVDVAARSTWATASEQ